MSNLIDSDIQRFVACLVLGYLENQQLDELYTLFCETSRHLVKEKKGLRYGNKPVDTSAGLIKIVSDYFMFKSQISEFLRLCPHSPVIVRLIDTEDPIKRLEIILETLKINLHKFEKVPLEKSKKRKIGQEDEFNVSQSNASTPEPENVAKRRRQSITTPFLLFNSSKENQSKSFDKLKVPKSTLKYSTSSETSEKEDSPGKLNLRKSTLKYSPSTATWDREDGNKAGCSNKITKLRSTPPIAENISEAILDDPELTEKLAEMINRTNANKVNPFDNKEELVNRTVLDPAFEEFLNEMIENVDFIGQRDESESTAAISSTHESPEKDNEVQAQEHELTTNPSTSKASISSNEALIPSTSAGIRNRLRPRKPPPPTKKGKIKKEKVNIISNEPYEGDVTPYLNQLMNQRNMITDIQQTKQLIFNVPFILDQNTEYVVSQQQDIASMPITIVSGSTEYTLIPADVLEQSEPLNDAPSTEQIEPSFVENPELLKLEIDKSEPKQKSVKKQCTPKFTRVPGFLEARSKSTPRRKATHIRILDFNQTPITRQSITEKSPATTPVANGITKKVPGSAPPNCESSKVLVRESPKLSSISESVIDENSNSNSNSVSATPRVGKDRRRRRITDAKLDESAKDTLDSLIDTTQIKTNDDWFKYRNNTQDLEKLARNQYQLKEAQAAVAVLQTKKKNPGRPKKIRRPKQVSKSKKITPTKKQKSNDSSLCLLSESIDDAETTDEIDEEKLKFKVRITPKKNKPIAKPKKDSVTNRSRRKVAAEKSTQKKESVVEMSSGEKREEHELNRSDTVQEVATTLTQLHETILSKSDSAVKNPDIIMLETPFKEHTEGLETPFKDVMQDFLPNTPRFAVPLTSETPMPKIFNTILDQTPSVLASLIKCNDILTPSFPITPGMKDTPPKDVPDGMSPSAASGYSRKTDYSSCSSYYKPDESEDIVQNFTQKDKRSEQHSESDVEPSLKIASATVLGSTKKVDCSVTIERVRSFTEDQKTLDSLHYNMMDDGLLSESLVTTTTASENSSGSYGSDFTCSTCTTESSDDEDNSVQKLLDLKTEEEKEKDWHCHNADKAKFKKSVMIDENTGEVRFPLRSWITPRKVEPQPESNGARGEQSAHAEDPDKVQREKEESFLKLRKVQEEMELKKKRMLENLRSDSKQIKKEHAAPLPKFRKSNVKNFKLPAEMPKAPIINKKDEILSTHMTERARPTTLKLLPPLPSSSRRKNATPKKTIVIDELPRQPSPVKGRMKKEKKTDVKSPTKSDRLSLETSSDNAVMPEGLRSLNISSSFTSSFEDETACTVVPASIKLDVPSHVSSIDKKEENLGIKLQAPEKKVPVEFMSDNSDDSDSSDDSDEDLAIKNADENMLNEQEFEFDPENFQTSKVCEPIILPMLVKFDGRTLHLKDTGNVDLFAFEPEKPQNYKKLPLKRCNEKKNSKHLSENSNFKNGKLSKKTENPNEQEKSDVPAKKNLNDSVITSILESIHGK